MSTQLHDFQLDNHSPAPILRKTYSDQGLTTAIVNVYPSQAAVESNLPESTALMTRHRHIALGSSPQSTDTSSDIESVLSFRPVLSLPPGDRQGTQGSIQVIPQILCSFYLGASAGESATGEVSEFPHLERRLKEAVQKMHQKVGIECPPEIMIDTNENILSGLSSVADFTLLLAHAFSQSPVSHRRGTTTAVTSLYVLGDNKDEDETTRAFFKKHRAHLPETEEHLENAWALCTFTDPVGLFDRDSKLKALAHLILTCSAEGVDLKIFVASHASNWYVPDADGHYRITEVGDAITRGGLTSSAMRDTLNSMLVSWIQAASEDRALAATKVFHRSRRLAGSRCKNVGTDPLMSVNRDPLQGLPDFAVAGPVHLPPRKVMQAYNLLVDTMARIGADQVMVRLRERGVDAADYSVSRAYLGPLNLHHLPTESILAAYYSGSEPYAVRSP